MADIKARLVLDTGGGKGVGAPDSSSDSLKEIARFFKRPSSALGLGGGGGIISFLSGLGAGAISALSTVAVAVIASAGVAVVLNAMAEALVKSLDDGPKTPIPISDETKEQIDIAEKKAEEGDIADLLELYDLNNRGETMPTTGPLPTAEVIGQKVIAEFEVSANPEAVELRDSMQDILDNIPKIVNPENITAAEDLSALAESYLIHNQDVTDEERDQLTKLIEMTGTLSDIEVGLMNELIAHKLNNVELEKKIQLLKRVNELSGGRSYSQTIGFEGDTSQMPYNQFISNTGAVLNTSSTVTAITSNDSPSTDFSDPRFAQI